MNLFQMTQQQQEVERMNKELLEQRAEMAHIRSSLQNKEKVRFIKIRMGHSSVIGLLPAPVFGKSVCLIQLSWFSVIVFRRDPSWAAL